MNYTCRNCGGELEPIGKGMGKCLYCRTINSMPNIVSEKFARAERLRREMKNFDSAATLYAQIIAEAPDEADAYWGIVLCRYGIEYVTDQSGESKATCHRTIENKIQNDSDYTIACEKGTPEQRAYYEKQAKYIDEVQRKILEIAHKEKPYDIFISYKAKDNENNPTLDSKFAQKIYFKLSNEGYRVFFAEETLKNVSGSEYEPYIYAALKSSKIMILFGSKAEYFEAPWVKNEWQRFMDMMAHGDEKTLLPVYYAMDPYMMPQEIASLQALNWQDSEAMITLMSIVENQFEQNVASNKDIEIENVIDKRELQNAQVKYNNALKLYQSGNSADALTILDELVKVRSNYAEAYWLRMLIKNHWTFDTLPLQQVDISNDPDYLQAIQNAPDNIRMQYLHYKDICLRNVETQKEYNLKAQELLKQVMSFSASIPGMQQVLDFKDKIEKIEKGRAFKEYLSPKDIGLWILGAFLLCIKGPLMLLSFSGEVYISELTIDSLLIRFLLLIPLLLLGVLTWGLPIVLTYMGYRCLGEKRKWLVLLLTIASLIGGTLAVYGKTEGIPGPRYSVYREDGIPFLLFYGIDCLAIILFGINILRKILLEYKLKNIRTEQKKLLIRYEDSLKQCGTVVKRKNDELLEEYQGKIENGKSILKELDVERKYAVWIKELIRPYRHEQEKRG